MDALVRTKFKVTKRDSSVDELRKDGDHVPYCAVDPAGNPITLDVWKATRGDMYLADDFDLLMCGSDKRTESEWRKELDVTWRNQLDADGEMTFGTFLERFRSSFDRPYPDKPAGRRFTPDNERKLVKTLADAIMAKMVHAYDEFDMAREAHVKLRDITAISPPTVAAAEDHEDEETHGRSRFMYDCINALPDEDLGDEGVDLENRMVACANEYEALWLDWHDNVKLAKTLAEEDEKRKEDFEVALVSDLESYEREMQSFRDLEHQIARAVRRRMRPSTAAVAPPAPSTALPLPAAPRLKAYHPLPGPPPSTAPPPSTTPPPSTAPPTAPHFTAFLPPPTYPPPEEEEEVVGPPPPTYPPPEEEAAGPLGTHLPASSVAHAGVNVPITMTPQEVRALTPGTASQLLDVDIGALSADAAKEFTAAAISALRPHAVMGFTRELVNALKPDAVKGFTPASISALSVDAAAGFVPASVNALTFDAVQALDQKLGKSKSGMSQKAKTALNFRLRHMGGIEDEDELVAAGGVHSRNLNLSQ